MQFLVLDAFTICSDLGAQENEACQKIRSYQRVVEKVGELIRRDLQGSEIRESLVAQLVKNLPALGETWVQPLGWEDPLNTWQPNPVFLPGEYPQTVESGGL